MRQILRCGFGDFYLSDLLGTFLSGLQEENFKFDPFLTNLAREIIAVKGTIQSLSTKVNILYCFNSTAAVGIGVQPGS